MVSLKVQNCFPVTAFLPRGLRVYNWKVNQGENRQEDNHVYM
ncbi:hypothetical protein FOQG_10178 [Fusarium oxysporum f. sp. raphani 54005]|uniref:Uncharacterized protein n=2 Tax=Fusarium oxysporum TaxID=5507 RepID=X0CUH8_FUSOX|nr:hypothetical protein FOQG_10178 [Fusarium oxysporum f. sp. raphani 54005]EXM19183.1 hypothetical protein FOTG_12801 [Fusarium oxysporum f. sp. vasinfectum 25433]